MKVLVVTQYFWPERFRINDLVVGLKEIGFEVEVLTGKPNYPKGKYYKGYSLFSKSKELWNGIKIRRCPVLARGTGSGLQLALNYLSFVMWGSYKAFFIREKFDRVFVFGTSPVTVCIPAIVYSKRKKVPVYFWAQDLWPESVSAVGMVKNKHLLHILNSLTVWIYRQCHKILIQSEGFAEYIQLQKVHPNDLIYYPNSTETLYQPIIAKKVIKEMLNVDGFKLLFAGNIGEAQDFDNVLKAMKIVIGKISNFHFFVVGNGRKFEFVKNEVTKNGLSNNVHLLGAFPLSDMPHFFSEADALLVSLKNETIFNLTIPSKIQSYLACAKPIIGALNGEGAKVISESNAGISVPASQPEFLAEAILSFCSMKRDTLRLYGENGRVYFNNHFEREMLLSKLKEIFEAK